MNLQREIEYAWCAGLFEGEGSITVDRRTKGRKDGTKGGSVRLCIGQAHDPAVLYRFADAFGMPDKVKGPHMKKNGTLPVWRVDFSGWDAHYVMEHISPYLTGGCAKTRKFDSFWYDEGGMDNAYRSTRARPEDGGERTL